MKNNFNDFALAILRIGFSGAMLTHGIPKVSMLFSNPSGFPDPIGIGGTATLIIAVLGEAIGPLLVLIGFKTRIAAIPTILTMAAATFVVHAHDDFAVKEKAIMYMIAFIAIALAGAGKYSVDGKK
ncbi:MAG: DoxX family protein [Gelidibacter sp.]|uniref:DoxX family protein n=1 Tax=Gelidibacter sp. TaxID=2018083 RepID=UPI0032635F47